MKEAGYIPWSPAHLMDARIAVSSSLHPLWNITFINTDFGISGTSQGIYLTPHSSRLQQITSGSDMTMTDDILNKAKVYGRGNLILGRSLTEEEAREHPLWLDLADGDQLRLDRYVEKCFRFGKDNFGYDAMMGFLVPLDLVPTERMVVLGNFMLKGHAYGYRFENAFLIGTKCNE